jgi:hypothetical protein
VCQGGCTAAALSCPQAITSLNPLFHDGLQDVDLLLRDHFCADQKEVSQDLLLNLTTGLMLCFELVPDARDILSLLGSHVPIQAAAGQRVGIKIYFCQKSMSQAFPSTTC